MGCSERRKEIKRRRHRRRKVAQLKGRVPKATVSEKTHIAGILRNLTPGADEIIDRWALEDRQ